MSGEKQFISHGHILFSRIVADGNHGNVKAERSIPVNLPIDATAIEICNAQDQAWFTATSQVNEQINLAFERQFLPAPIHAGPRYHVYRWRPDSLFIIIPQGTEDDVPGGVKKLYWQTEKGHRLQAVKALATHLARIHKVSDIWDLSHGDFTGLDDAYQTLLHDTQEQDADDEPEPDDECYDDEDDEYEF